MSKNSFLHKKLKDMPLVKAKTESIKIPHILNESGKPIGVLSTSDFVRAFSDYGALLAG